MSDVESLRLFLLGFSTGCLFFTFIVVMIFKK